MKKIESVIKSTFLAPIIVILFLLLFQPKVTMTAIEFLSPFIFLIAALVGSLVEFILEKIIATIKKYPPRMEGGGY